jgi:hypothetical protein
MEGVSDSALRPLAAVYGQSLSLSASASGAEIAFATVRLCSPLFASVADAMSLEMSLAFGPRSDATDATDVQS